MRLPDRTLWLGRAALYEDRIVLSGWQLRGRYRRTLRLGEVDRVEWWAVEDGPNFAFHLHSGESVALRLKRNAGTWKFKLDHLLGHEALAAPGLPDTAPSRADAA